MKTILLVLVFLIATLRLAPADSNGPAYPNITRANIHGLSLGESPARVLASLKAQHVHAATIEKTNCEAQRIARIRAGKDPDTWSHYQNAKCVSSIGATFGKATFKIDFVQDVTLPSAPTVAYRIEYTYPQVTEADAQNAIDAAIRKYGTPTLRGGNSLLDTGLEWIPLQCGMQALPSGTTMPAGSNWDPCSTSPWGGIPYLLLDTNFHDLTLFDNPRYQRILKARSVVEARVHSSGVSF